MKTRPCPCDFSEACLVSAAPNRLEVTPVFHSVRRHFLILSALWLFLLSARAQNTDAVTFANGDQLTGKIVNILNGKVSFHSDMIGDLTIPLGKIKSLHTTREFAVGEKGLRVTRKTVFAMVPVGKIALENKAFTLTLPAGEVHSYPTNQIAYAIGAGTFHREMNSESHFLYGWTGSVTLGATLVKATNSAQTYSGSVALLRSIPTTSGLPPGSKTTFNLSGTYGLARNPEIISGGQIYQTASTAKTDILHGDTEYDKYLSLSTFVLGNASADHNYGSGLQLQQAYGAGFGRTVLNKTNNIFDLKAALQYQQQQFYNGISSGLGTPSENLIGASLNESWNRTFAHDVKFVEYVTLMPTFNVVRAYSAVANANLVFPVYKRLNFSVTSTDNYLGDPPQGFLRNTFQFTAGITYTVK